MPRYLTRDRIAILAALAVAAVLLPFRASWPDTSVALLLVVVMVGVAAAGNRVAGGLPAVRAALWFGFFCTVRRITGSRSAARRISRRPSCCCSRALAVPQLAARARRGKVITVTDAGYLTQIHGTASLAESATVPDVVVNHVSEQLTGLPDLDGARFGYGACPATRRAWSQTGP